MASRNRCTRVHFLALFLSPRLSSSAFSSSNFNDEISLLSGSANWRSHLLVSALLRFSFGSASAASSSLTSRSIDSKTSKLWSASVPLNSWSSENLLKLAPHADCYSTLPSYPWCNFCVHCNSLLWKPVDGGPVSPLLRSFSLQFIYVSEQPF